MNTSSIRWFRSFKSKQGITSSVLNHYRREELLTMLVISAPIQANDEIFYIYSVFNSYVDLFNYIVSVPNKNRVFNERVDEIQLQKPRFDIDIDEDKVIPPGYSSREEFGEWVKDTVIFKIIEELTSNGLDVDVAKNILVYTSHGKEKVSYHIVVDKFMHSTCHDALGFYKKIITDDIIQYVDRSIYDRNHTLRILWCHKAMSNRSKIFNESFMYKGNVVKHEYDRVYGQGDERIKALHIFGASLITHTSVCSLLPDYAEHKKTSSSWDDCEELNPRILKDVEFLIAAKFRSDTLYSIIGSKGRLINLKRNEKHFCPLCHSNHDKNALPYVIVINDRYVHWSCGRNEDRKKLYLGEASIDLSSFKSKFDYIDQDEIKRGIVAGEDVNNDINDSCIINECNSFLRPAITSTSSPPTPPSLLDKTVIPPIQQSQVRVNSNQSLSNMMKEARFCSRPPIKKKKK